ncbi:MAG: hypothetical protein PHW06_01300 [Candidatus Cloacimonas acidaminovorans]|jgi:uncharacterized Zn finger protein|nr:hypothetical protein [Candidatus Cloacimonas acidaminovorans]HOE55925.1 hypothetical protein [Candidatus Cloacimonas acidaminovorans]HOM80029.1 hypothetical protein [Candidatus Cloacimonas acidaminovorans]HRU83553.1 hypothetical protein [Candidatus Cloacimonas sp.]
MNLERPQLHSAIIKRLGNITFWRSKINFRDKMEEIYTRVGKKAENILEQ